MFTETATRGARYSGHPCDECGTTDRYIERAIYTDDGRLWGFTCSERCARAAIARECGATLIRPRVGAHV